jgi:hypothetical protein
LKKRPFSWQFSADIPVVIIFAFLDLEKNFSFLDSFLGYGGVGTVTSISNSPESSFFFGLTLPFNAVTSTEMPIRSFSRQVLGKKR